MYRPYTNTVAWNCIDATAELIACFFKSLKQEVIASYLACDCENNMLARLLRWLGLSDGWVRQITYIAHVLFILASVLVAVLLIYVVLGGMEHGILTDVGHWWE